MGKCMSKEVINFNKGLETLHEETVKNRKHMNIVNSRMNMNFNKKQQIFQKLISQSKSGDTNVELNARELYEIKQFIDFKTKMLENEKFSEFINRNISKKLKAIIRRIRTQQTNENISCNTNAIKYIKALLITTGKIRHFARKNNGSINKEILPLSTEAYKQLFQIIKKLQNQKTKMI